MFVQFIDMTTGKSVIDFYDCNIIPDKDDEIEVDYKSYRVVRKIFFFSKHKNFGTCNVHIVPIR